MCSDGCLEGGAVTLCVLANAHISLFRDFTRLYKPYCTTVVMVRLNLETSDVQPAGLNGKRWY